jgi:hypothetical protein
MTLENQRANKGEWSELYVFLRILVDEFVYSEDSKGRTDQSSVINVVEVIRECNNVTHIYKIGKNVEIIENGTLIDSIAKDKVLEYCNMVLERIIEGDQIHDGAFPIEGSQEILNKFRFSSISANSKHKEDILLKVRNSIDGSPIKVGLSIKSEIGSKPTLMNSGKNTRIRYKINNFSINEMNIINQINKTSHGKYFITKRIQELFRSDKEVVFDKYIGCIFFRNLQMIDTIMPEIFAHFVLYHYKRIGEGINTSEMIISGMEVENPLKLESTQKYKYKFKEFLSSSALGMTPGKLWDGTNNAVGGYIVVKENGDLRYHGNFNPDQFKEYLLRTTKVDRPSTTRHDYCYVYEDNDDFYIDFNIQIRFK